MVEQSKWAHFGIHARSREGTLYREVISCPPWCPDWSRIKATGRSNFLKKPRKVPGPPWKSVRKTFRVLAPKRWKIHNALRGTSRVSSFLILRLSQIFVRCNFLYETFKSRNDELRRLWIENTNVTNNTF